MMKLVILMIGICVLLLGSGCASYDSMYEVDYSQREDNVIHPWVRDNMHAWLRCDVSDIEYQLVERQSMQSYFLVNCPKQGFEDVKCMFVDGKYACIDSKGGIQHSNNSDFFVY